MTIENAAKIYDSKGCYKVGVKVRVKPDLNDSKRYYGNCWFPKDMYQYRGKTGIITNITHCDELKDVRYMLDISKGTQWVFSHDMLEPVSQDESPFKVGDMVMFKKDDIHHPPGIFQIKGIDEDIGYLRIEHYEKNWFSPSRFVKVPLFKVGDVVTFRNIKDDSWFVSTSSMRTVEGKCGIVMEVVKDHYPPQKLGQDGCKYCVTPLGSTDIWYVTSASLELVTPVTSDITVPHEGLSSKGSDFDLDNPKPFFKVGDKVIPCECESDKEGSRNWYTPKMKELIGKVHTIASVEDKHYVVTGANQDGYAYTLAEFPHCIWSSTMLRKAGALGTESTNNKTTKQNENQLQREDSAIVGRGECTGVAVCNSGIQAQIAVGHLSYREVSCKG